MKKQWPKFLFGFLLLIFVLILLLKFAEVKQILTILKKVNYGWFVLALAAQASVFLCLAACYKTLARTAVSFLKLLKTSVAMVFVDHAVPSFSASGNALLYWTARKAKVSRQKAAFLIGMNVFLNFLVYLVVFFAGLVWLLNSKSFSSGLIWFSLIIVVGFVLVFSILWTETGARRFKFVLNKVLQKWPKVRKKVKNKIESFYRAKRTFPKPAFLKALCWIVGCFAAKILTLFAVFFSLSYVINPGVLITGYVVASALAAISFVRLGVYEASMALTYFKLGLNYNLALTATLLFRGISFWIPFVLGFFFFRMLLKETVS